MSRYGAIALFVCVLGNGFSGSVSRLSGAKR